jgi:alkanesulfonate monooxygenase SsuD/methylene tetrahydromethanopterin reductase-like flavin-dependent oxidoreductase (luciferase family)
MKIGIGLPVAIGGVRGKILIDWARRSEEAGFQSLSVLDRLVFDNYEALTTLAAAAAVTSRAQLITAVLLAPLHTNTALLAKQAATIDAISGGRLVLGIGVGSREDDYEAAGADFHHRGRNLNRALSRLRRIWDGIEGIGPAPASPGGPQILIGGRSPAALWRAAHFGEGWIQGGGGPQSFADGVAAVRAAWEDAGRGDLPRLVASARFALGADARRQAEASYRAYYNFRGAPSSDPTGGALLTPEAIREVVAAYERLGCDDLLFSPAASDPGQIEQLARVLFG